MIVVRYLAGDMMRPLTNIIYYILSKIKEESKWNLFMWMAKESHIQQAR